jgi:hypothetical protein
MGFPHVVCWETTEDSFPMLPCLLRSWMCRNLRDSRWLRVLTGVVLLASAYGAGAQTCTTTITGKVYSPNGVDPLPNILVYVPTTAVQPFTAGVQGCGTQQVSGNPLVSTTTAADGSFSLTNPNLPGTQTLVIQAGKWRRQYPGVVVTSCTTNTAPVMSMPANQSEGDIPHIAVVTGSADALECVLRKVGISDSEFTDPSGSGRINLYAAAGAPGVTTNASGTALPVESTLMANASTLNGYDIAMFSCEGNAYTKSPTELSNLVNFANVGGRVFATHFEYSWLYQNGPFAGTAKWTGTNASLSNGLATIDTTYAEGKVLADWLKIVDTADPYGKISLTTTKQNQTGVIAPTQSWATLDSSGTVMQFTFDTPISSATTATLSIHFTNTPAIFMQGDTSDNIAINVTNTSTASADTTLNLTLTLPQGVTATNLTGVGASTGWVCSAPTLTCNRTTPLAAGSSDGIQLTVGIAATAPVDNQTVTAALAGGGLAGTNQCGRVLYNEYHVEAPVTTGLASKTFPNECDTQPESAQEKFLEFSVYNLSNFVAPTSNDTITIQGLSTITWPTPAPIYYGTPLSGTQLDATANTPGTFVYTPPAGTVEPLGNDTLSVVFTPTDTVGYQGATASVTLQVLQQPTKTTITNIVSPIYYGQIIADVGLETVVGTLGGGVDGGTLNFLIDGVLVCSLPANIAGVCPPPTGAGYSAGTHTIQSIYTGDANYSASSSAIYNVIVLPDPTATALTTSLTPAVVGQAVTLTAKVADQYITAAGMVQFLDGTQVIGSSQVDATGAAKLVTSTLFVGTHSLTACFIASLNYNGSCSSPVSEVISTVPTAPLATVTLLTSSLDPSVVGQSVTFTAKVATTGPFVATPTGTVMFLDGTTNLGSVPVDSTGSATYSTTALAAGTHNITATYAYVLLTNVVPTVTFAPSSSTVLQQVVTTGIGSAGYGFVMTVTPTTISAGVGVSTALSVTITDLNGFNEPVQLACAGVPYETSCTFAQTTIPAGGGTTALIVSPTPPRPCSAVAMGGEGSRGGVPLLAMFGVAAWFARRRRRMLQGIALAFALCLLPMLNGCSSGCADFGTQPGNYSFTITGNAVGTAVPVTTTPAGSAALTQTQTIIMKIVP